MSVLPTQSEGGADTTFPSAKTFPLLQPCLVDFEDAFELYGRVTGYAQHSFFIEHDSHQEGDTRRFSYLGSNPYLVIKGKGHSIHTYRAGVWNEQQGDPFSLLQHQFVQGPSGMWPSFPPFIGGAVGCFSYDLARKFEVLPEQAQDDLQFPDLYFLFVEVFVVVDHQMSTIWLVFSPSPERLAKENSEELYREGQMRLLELEKKIQSVESVVDGENSGHFSIRIQGGSQLRPIVIGCANANNLLRLERSIKPICLIVFVLKASLTGSHHPHMPGHPFIGNCGE